MRRKIPSAEWLFAKILIAFARYTRCRRNNENYDKLRNLWCCSMYVYKIYWLLLMLLLLLMLNLIGSHTTEAQCLAHSTEQLG